MSEPRKLYTGSASGGSMLDQEQYEAARRRAQQQAEQNARRRTLQQPMRTAQGRHINQRPAAVQQPAPEPVQQPAAEPVRQAAEENQAPRPLTRAQQQALAYRAAADRRYAETLQFPTQRLSVERERRSVNRAAQQPQQPRAERPRAQVQQMDLRNAQGSRAVYDYDAETRQEPHGGIQLEEAAPAPRPAKPKAAHHAAPATQSSGGGRKPPRDDDEPPRKSKGRKSGKKGGDGKGGKGKKKKKIRWWQILLITLLVIALIFGGAYALIMGAIAPEMGSVKLDRLLNTPKEFQDDEFNFLMVGIDRSTQKAGDDTNDEGVDDGNTDMILYVHFNNKTGEMKMLQIPRDTMVTTDRSVSGNYRINNIAKTQATTSGGMNMAALCTQVATMYKLPVDGYMTIRLEMLVQLVDTFGGIELYVPQEMDYGGSHLDQGYQTLNGDACEFLLRTRHIYPDGDIGRLNMQRQFYSALFRRLKSIGNIWDVAKLTPAVLNYMETDLSASKLVSFAVSMLKIDSNKIMMCQMPVKMGAKYNGEAVVYSARQEDADLLNEYFRENTGFVDASELQLCDDSSVLGFDLSSLASTDANVQYMGQLNQEAVDAQQNQNLDGSYTVEYADSESTDTADSESESSSDSAA